MCLSLFRKFTLAEVVCLGHDKSTWIDLNSLEHWEKSEECYYLGFHFPLPTLSLSNCKSKYSNTLVTFWKSYGNAGIEVIFDNQIYFPSNKGVLYPASSVVHHLVNPSSNLKISKCLDSPWGGPKPEDVHVYRAPCTDFAE